MKEKALNIIYFGTESKNIKMLQEVTDNSCEIVENNEVFKNKTYLSKLRGNHIAIIDGDCIVEEQLENLINLIKTELKFAGIIYTSQEISKDKLTHLFNDIEIDWYLTKPWIGSNLAKAISRVETKIIKKIKPMTKPLTAVDPLTGLPNYTSFRQQLSFEFTNIQKSGLPISLIRINFDDLKNINNRFGFQAADQTIREICISIRKFLPQNFYLARFNGDNLAIIAKGLGYQFAEKLAEDIRKYVINSGSQLSLSLGVGTYPQHARTLEELISATDFALLTAKRRGKNQTVVVNASQV